MAGSSLYMPVPEDFRLSTWLAIGACIYAIAERWFPFWVVVQFPILLLAARTIQATLMARGLLTSGRSNTVPGRYSTRIPASNPEDQGIVVFVLGARINHPMGRLAPGFLDAGTIFTGMWRECNRNRKKYGYLGKTSTLMASQEEGGLTMVWLTYWKTVEGLRDFGASDAHRALQIPWLAKKYPYLGIMHETYSAPKGNWETIYHHFQPFGMGKTKFMVGPSLTDDSNAADREKRLRFASPLVKAEGREMRSMFSRMGRGEDIALARWNPEAKDFDE